MKEITSKTSELRRPGPYRPASELVPKNQKVETVEYSDNLFDVLLRICQEGYSQTPVKKDGKVIGMIDMQSLKLILQKKEIEAQLKKYPCGDFINEKICYLNPEEWVENKSEWLEDGSALVGNPGEIIGLLTSADILRALSDYAEAFILIEEIETTLRPILEQFFPANKREEIFEKRNALEVKKKEAKKQTGHVEDQYKKIEDLTFGEYESLVEDREFESVLKKFSFGRGKNLSKKPRRLEKSEMISCISVRGRAYQKRRNFGCLKNISIRHIKNCSPNKLISKLLPLQPNNRAEFHRFIRRCSCARHSYAL